MAKTSPTRAKSRLARGARRGRAAQGDERERRAMGDCRAQLAELFAYLDGELSASRCDVIERHLRACHCCDALARGVRRAIAVCRGAGRERLPAAVRVRAQQRIERLLGAAPRPRGRGTGSH